MNAPFGGLLANGAWAVLLVLAIPGIVILFALFRRRNVRAALSIDRFSFKLEATDRLSDLPPTTNSESNALTHSDI